MGDCGADTGMKQGFTLVELMVVAAISSIILIVLMRFLASGYPLSRVVFEQAGATETARLQLKRMVKALREARESDTGGYPLVVAGPQQLIFYSDVDGDDATERIRYELSGTQLERGVIKPSGDPLSYNESNEVVAVVAASVRNGSDPLFVYYTGDYPADPTELAPTDLTEVKYIEFRLLLDADPDSDPPAIDVVSQVQLRNLKTNLGEEVGG